MAIEVNLPEKIQNLDILDLINRAIRYCEDIANSTSSTRDETSTHDIKRMKDAHALFSSRFEVYNGDPELDTPKYHPTGRPVPRFPEIEPVQNADAQAVLNHWIALITEISLSDSAERSTGFKDADSVRVSSVLTKLGKLLDTIEGSPEVDLPNASDIDPPQNQQ